jgi:hypothetical protein
MTRKLFSTLIILVSFACMAYGQTKMLTGQKHVIFVDIPKNWLQAENDQLPFFIKPDDQNVSNKTYMYVYGLDYQSQPDMDGWIKGDNADMANKHPGLKIDSLPINLSNIKENGYLTGRYKIITYEYSDRHKEAMLVIECKNTIVTAVMSTVTKEEFEKYLPSFKELVQTIKVLGATVKIDK